MQGEFTIQLSKYPRQCQALVLEIFFEAQVLVNVIYLRSHPKTPRIYKSGVVYRRENAPEIWKDIPTILEDGWDDCEGLAAWLAAELRVYGAKTKAGKQVAVPCAMVRLIRQGRKAFWHAVVIDKRSGKKWDPSKVLGMRGAA